MRLYNRVERLRKAIDRPSSDDPRTMTDMELAEIIAPGRGAQLLALGFEALNGLADLPEVEFRAKVDDLLKP